jgi:hypothetical protein
LVKLAANAKVIVDSAGRSAARGRFPDHAKNFPDTTIYVPVKLN